MVDRGKAGDVNEAARSFAETLAESYRVVYGQAAESAERQQQRAREFSELVSTNLREQAEAGRANAQELSEQATESAREGVRTLAETTTGLLGTATGAVGSTVEGAERAAEAAVFPIEGYDEMNVEEVSERLDGLSVEELQLVRDYEETNKKRETLLEKMDRKIRAS
jgi:hypothetical protein